MILWRKGLGFSSNLSNLSIFPPDINDPASHSVKWSLGIVWSKKNIRSCLHRHHQTGSLISDQKINKLDSFELKPTPFNLLFTKSFFLTSDSLVAETKSCLHLNFYSCCCCRWTPLIMPPPRLYSPDSIVFELLNSFQWIAFSSFGGGTNNHRRASCWCSYWTVASMAFMQKAVIANFQVITDTSTLGPLYVCGLWLLAIGR